MNEQRSLLISDRYQSRWLAKRRQTHFRAARKPKFLAAWQIRNEEGIRGERRTRGQKKEGTTRVKFRAIGPDDETARFVSRLMARVIHLVPRQKQKSRQDSINNASIWLIPADRSRSAEWPLKSSGVFPNHRPISSQLSLRSYLHAYAIFLCTFVPERLRSGIRWKQGYTKISQKTPADWISLSGRSDSLIWRCPSVSSCVTLISCASNWFADRNEWPKPYTTIRLLFRIRIRTTG